MVLRTNFGDLCDAKCFRETKYRSFYEYLFTVTPITVTVFRNKPNRLLSDNNYITAVIYNSADANVGRMLSR